MPRRELSRTEKYLYVGSFLGVVFLVGVGLLARHVEAEPVWNIPSPQPTPQPNGYDLYLNAFRAFTPAKPPIDPVNDPEILKPAQAAARYSLPRRLQWLRANQKALALVKSAQAASYVIPQSEDAFHFDFSHSAGMRELARIKVAEADTYIIQHQFNDAFTCGLDTVQMGVHRSNGGVLLDFLGGAGLVSISSQITESSLPQLTGPQAHSQAIRLARMLDGVAPFEKIVRGEATHGLRSLRQLFSTPNWRRHSAHELEDKEPISKRLAFFVVPKKSLVQDLTDWGNYYVALAASPYKSSVSSQPPKIPDQFTSYFITFTTFREGQNIYLCKLAWLRTLLIRLHLQAYRQQFGHYPTSLQQLTELPKKHLADPFSATSATLNYRAQPNGYLLWSIGPDATNNSAQRRIKYRSAFSTVPISTKGDLVISVPPPAR